MLALVFPYGKDITSDKLSTAGEETHHIYYLRILIGNTKTNNVQQQGIHTKCQRTSLKKKKNRIHWGRKKKSII